LEIAFKTFDIVNCVLLCFLFLKDGSGGISWDEVKKILGGDQTHDDVVWQEMIREVNQNDDGEISFSEFTDMMHKLFVD
jgi:calcium-dependent protein kinase